MVDSQKLWVASEELKKKAIEATKRLADKDETKSIRAEIVEASIEKIKKNA